MIDENFEVVKPILLQLQLYATGGGDARAMPSRHSWATTHIWLRLKICHWRGVAICPEISSRSKIYIQQSCVHLLSRMRSLTKVSKLQAWVIKLRLIGFIDFFALEKWFVKRACFLFVHHFRSSLVIYFLGLLLLYNCAAEAHRFLRKSKVIGLWWLRVAIYGRLLILYAWLVHFN